MKVNFVATKGKLDDACINLRKYAAKHGFGYDLFMQVLKGTYPSINSPAAVAILNHLREKGFLVEEPDQEQAA